MLSESVGRKRLSLSVILSLVVSVAGAATPGANTQIVIDRNAAEDTRTDIRGVVELVVEPGIPNAKVRVDVDGQKIADGLLSPHRVTVDFGPVAVQHKVAVTAWSNDAKKRTVKWQQTINRGMHTLGLKVQPVDYANGLFEAKTTAASHDPIEAVELWENGQVVATLAAPPYRFRVPPSMLDVGFVQVTARTKAGEEIADFWTINGAIHTEEIAVREVPIFVSVVDRNGRTQDKVDRSLFRILDGGAEATIVEFGKAFDQPISIALLVDASASMTNEMQNAAKAVNSFIERTLKPGDRCSVTAVQEVPRRTQPLTGDAQLVAAALGKIQPKGQTALFDAVRSAVRELEEEKVRRAIIVLTDGSDTASISSYDEIEKMVRQAGIPIYFIAYATGSATSREVDQLRYLAAQTGGFVAVAAEATDLKDKYREIENDLRAQFAIRYQVTDVSKPNEWRPVRVVLDSPVLSARTIRGYFTP